MFSTSFGCHLPLLTSLVNKLVQHLQPYNPDNLGDRPNIQLILVLHFPLAPLTTVLFLYSVLSLLCYLWTHQNRGAPSVVSAKCYFDFPRSDCCFCICLGSVLIRTYCLWHGSIQSTCVLIPKLINHHTTLLALLLSNKEKWLS